MTNLDPHCTLNLHRHRFAELHAEADRARLARAFVRTGGTERSRWWSRAGRRHQGAATRAPAMS